MKMEIRILEEFYQLEVDSFLLQGLQGSFACVDLAAISNDPSGEKYVTETLDINFSGRVNNANLSKKNGLHRYILPSSCSRIDKLKESDYGTVLSSLVE